ncbi:MAG: cation diffusion facilitator family transporter [Pseudomonadota bacterium]
MNSIYTETEEQYRRYARLASLSAIGIVLFLILIKGATYYLSGSATFLGSLADSIVDGAVSLMMLAALQLSIKPADEQHRHGHGKIEGVAALFQSAFLAAAGLFIVLEAFSRFIDLRPVSHEWLGISVSILSILLTGALIMVQRYCLKRAPSLAIEADMAHYKTDFLLNSAVIIVLLAYVFGAPIWLDPLAAVCVAAYFFWEGARIALKSLDMLLDKEVSKDVRQKIEAIVSAHQETKGIHDLRTRQSGMTLHISFDVEMEPELTLRASHDIVRELEQEIVAAFPQAEVLIHVDPRGDTHDTRHKVAGIHH